MSRLKLASIIARIFLLLLKRLAQHHTQHCIRHANRGNANRQTGNPDALVLQEPRQLRGAAVVEGISANRVSARARQRLAQRHVVIRAVCTAAAKLNHLHREKNHINSELRICKNECAYALLNQAQHACLIRIRRT